jgi:DNA-binding response OmpR family regulator
MPDTPISPESPGELPMDMANRILVVEDDAELRSLVAQRLTETGYEVQIAETGTEALAMTSSFAPDLILLDIMLPEMDGLEVCRRLRAEYPLLYIVMLTARSDELDRVVGLEVGADDYVTKPFSLQELVARVRAALRRIRLTAEQAGEAMAGAEERLEFPGLAIDAGRREVQLDGTAVHLTVREFDLLHFLATHAGRPFTRMQLLERVWDIHYEGYDRTVDSHVQRLRAKIEVEPGNPRYIRTVWGVGYKFEPEPLD